MNERENGTLRHNNLRRCVPEITYEILMSKRSKINSNDGDIKSLEVILNSIERKLYIPSTKNHFF